MVSLVLGKIFHKYNPIQLDNKYHSLYSKALWGKRSKGGVLQNLGNRKLPMDALVRELENDERVFPGKKKFPVKFLQRFRWEICDVAVYL